MKHTNKKGFTLIEVLIVIAIIGILSSIVLVGLGGFRGRGRDARRISDLRQVQNALELYFSKEGAYPDSTDWDDLADVLRNAAIGVTNIPKDPTASQSYGYCREGSSYILAAKLEDTGNPSLKDQEGATFIGCSPGDFSSGDCTNPSSGIYCIQL